MVVALPKLRVGDPVRHEALSVFPLFSDTDSRVDYRLSEAALADESLLVEEVSDSGSVPDLLVENKGDLRVLFLEGEELESEVEVSHVMPAPPENIKVNRHPAAENCDAEDLPSVRRGRRVTIGWDPVTTSHPTIGKSGPVEVARYQVVVEYDVEDEEENEVTFVFSADFPPSDGRMRVTVPRQFIAAGIDAGLEEFKFEILVRAVNGNQTAVESCFEIEEIE